MCTTRLIKEAKNLESAKFFNDYLPPSQFFLWLVWRAIHRYIIVLTYCGRASFDRTWLSSIRPVVIMKLTRPWILSSLGRVIVIGPFCMGARKIKSYKIKSKPSDIVSNYRNTINTAEKLPSRLCAAKYNLIKSRNSYTRNDIRVQISKNCCKPQAFVHVKWIAVIFKNFIYF